MLVLIRRRSYGKGWLWRYEIKSLEPLFIKKGQVPVGWQISKQFIIGMDMLIDLDAWVSGRK